MNTTTPFFYAVILMFIFYSDRVFANEASPDIASQELVPIRTLTITPKAYKEYGEFFGTVEGIREANLISHGGGHVNKVLVRSGDRVRRGQKLCDIDLQLHQTRYDSAKISENVAKKDLERINRHLKSGNASKIQLQKARLQWLESKRARLEAEKLLEGSCCESPIDGVVTGVEIKAYENLASKSSTINIAEISKIRLIVGIPESESAVYDRGRPVTVSLNSNRSKIWKGVLDNIALKMDQKNKTFAAEVFVNNRDFGLRPGLTVKAKILKFDLKNQVVIPSETVLIRDKKQVVMIQKDGKAKQHPVDILTSYDGQSVIRSGLQPGDHLIIKGQSQVVDGAPVKVISE